MVPAVSSPTMKLLRRLGGFEEYPAVSDRNRIGFHRRAIFGEGSFGCALAGEELEGVGNRHSEENACAIFSYISTAASC